VMGGGFGVKGGLAIFYIACTFIFMHAGDKTKNFQEQRGMGQLKNNSQYQ